MRRTLSRPKASQREARRARIILLRSQGKSQEVVSKGMGLNRPVVVHWEKRFRQSGMAGLREARRSGRNCSIDPAIKASIISEAVRPPPGHTQWSTRKMAQAKGVSSHTVGRLWRANGIKRASLAHLQALRGQGF